jgi:transcriptional regulator with XRE-family HTH domain
LLRKLGNVRRIRSERSPTLEELSKASGVPRRTIVGLEEGTRKAQQVTIDKLAKALGVVPGELTNEEGVTILEEREGNRAHARPRGEVRSRLDSGVPVQGSTG